MLPHRLSAFITFRANGSETDEAPDLDFTPAELLSEDPCHPDVFCNAMLPFTNAPKGIKKFREDAMNEPITHMSLAAIRKIYEERRASTAIKLLKLKVRIDPSDDIIPHDAAHLLRPKPEHRIDAFCAVGRDMGLEGLLPNVAADIAFQLRLEPQRAKLPLTDKHSFFGCIVKGRTFYLGMSDTRKVFFLFRPEVASRLRRSPQHTGGGSDTALADDRLDAFAVYWAWLLAHPEIRTHTPLTAARQYLINNEAFSNVTNLR